MLIISSLEAAVINGTIRGKGSGTLAGASVVVLNGSGKTVCYAITDGKGAFHLNIPDDAKPATMKVNFMGYEKKVVAFADVKDGMTITLKEGGVQLKEVKAKAQRIKSRGDTLTYSVAGFRQGQDRSIADVIKKMPGLEVKADGKIEYQGKAINKFYIEGLDMMGSQYGVANKNISADKVKSVQVLENHQPVKSLRNVTFSENAAINIVLKDDAKAVWSGCADIGLGYGGKTSDTQGMQGDRLLYDCRLMGMRFTRRFQTLMMYKNNDTGKDIGSEVIDLATLLRGHTENTSGVLSLMSVGAADVDRSRYTFNHSHLLAGNWLVKTGKDSELRLQGNGFVDKQDMQAYHSTTYLTLADMPVVTEEQSVSNTRSEWKGEVNYQYNGSQTYLKNNLRGYIDFNKSIGTTTLNSTDITEMMVRPRKRYLTEDFQLSHTTQQKHVYDISSYTSYHYLPGQLLTINDQTEHLNLGMFSTQNAMKLKLRLGRHYLNNVIGIDYSAQQMEADGSTSTDRFTQAYWTPSISLVFGRHKVDASAKMSYAHQRVSEPSTSDTANYLWIDPKLSWRWSASAVSEFSATASYGNAPLRGTGIFSTPVFTNYRNMTSNRGQCDVRHSTTASAAYKYSNPVIGLFFNLRPTLMRSTCNMLYRTSLKDNIFMMEATDKDYAMLTKSLSGRISKSVGWAKLFAGLSASYTVNDYSLLIGNDIADANMKTISLGLDYSLRPCQLLSIEGRSSMRHSKQAIMANTITTAASSSGISGNTTTDWEHTLSAYIYPANGWMVSLKNELYHSNTEGSAANYFCDIAVSYKTKRWELSLAANNVIGTSQFVRRTLSNTIISYSITNLRPREILLKWSFDM